MIFVYWYLKDNNLMDSIHILQQVHDQLTTVTVTEELAKWWAPQLDKLMCDAAKVVIHTGILKADTQISPFWTK